MTPAEQKELTIWGGLGLAVVVVGSGWLWWNGESDEADASTAAGLHAEYRELYESEGDRQLKDQANALVQKLSREQQAEYDQAKASLIFPGVGPPGIPREVAGSVLMSSGYFANDLDYTTANGLVGQVNARLRARAKSLNVGLRNKLPLEDDTKLDNANTARRSLQLARLTCAAMAVDRLLDVGVTEINQVNIEPQRNGWRDPSGELATLAVLCDVVGSHQAIDQFLRGLVADRNGLALDDVQVKENEQKNVECQVVVTLTLPARKDWDLPVRPLVAAKDLPKSTPASASASGPGPAVGGGRPLR